MISFGFCMSTQLLKYKIDPVGSCPGNAIGISKKNKWNKATDRLLISSCWILIFVCII